MHSTSGPLPTVRYSNVSWLARTVPRLAFAILLAPSISHSDRHDHGMSGQIATRPKRKFRRVGATCGKSVVVSTRSGCRPDPQSTVVVPLQTPSAAPAHQVCCLDPTDPNKPVHYRIHPASPRPSTQ